MIRVRKERKWAMRAYNEKSNLLSRSEKFSLRKRLEPRFKRGIGVN